MTFDYSASSERTLLIGANMRFYLSIVIVFIDRTVSKPFLLTHDNKLQLFGANVIYLHLFSELSCKNISSLAETNCEIFTGYIFAYY